jgi:predicted nucleic acid-binding protein
MTNTEKSESIKIFLDSSIFVSATLSISGGSFRLCKEGNEGRLTLFTNRYVLDEVREVFMRKCPRKLEDFEKLFEWSGTEVQKYPTKKSVKDISPLISDKNDAPILAGAIYAKVHFLATLDNDFFTSILQQANVPLVIVKPRTFFQEYF